MAWLDFSLTLPEKSSFRVREFTRIIWIFPTGSLGQLISQVESKFAVVKPNPAIRRVHVDREVRLYFIREPQQGFGLWLGGYQPVAIQINVVGVLARMFNQTVWIQGRYQPHSVVERVFKADLFYEESRGALVSMGLSNDQDLGSFKRTPVLGENTTGLDRGSDLFISVRFPAGQVLIAK